MRLQPSRRRDPARHGGRQTHFGKFCQLFHARLCRRRRAARGGLPRPGTELAFARDVELDHGFGRLLPRLGFGKIAERVARFRKINESEPEMHHDALEFPSGRIVLVTRLCEGQVATVLQLPAGSQPAEGDHEAAAPSVRPVTQIA